MSMNGEYSEPQVDISEVIQELERQFPRELQIAMQAVYIRKLQEKLSGKESNV